MVNVEENPRISLFVAYIFYKNIPDIAVGTLTEHIKIVSSISKKIKL